MGKSEVRVSPVVFGAWAIGGWMWGGADRKDAVRAIEACLDAGITTIDTAPVYGFGLSEQIIGDAVRGKRDKFQILTKYGLRWDAPMGEYHFSSVDNEGKPVDIYKHAPAERVVHECERSLKYLGTDYVDLLQIHWPDGTTPIEETMSAVEKLIRQGKVRAAGVSNYSVDQMREAGQVIPLASNQVPYSMVRRDIEKDVVPYCIEQGISILPYSPLQRGLLTGKFGPDTRFNEGDSRPGTPHFRKDNLIRINEFLDTIRPMAESKQASLAQLVLAWTLRMPGISCVLAGARNPEQVRENAGAMQVGLSDEEMIEINKQLDALELELDLD